MCERVFSLMTNIWRKERNRLSIKTVEAELIVKHNMDLNCLEFYKFLKTDQIGDEIVRKIGTDEKYK